MAVTLHQPNTPPPTAPETPTQAVVRAAQQMRYCTDENGRRIGWRKLNALEDFDLTEIADKNSGNEEWMLRATIAFGVREIDGEAIARPTSKTALRAMIARLDDAGMSAVLGMFSEQSRENADQAEAALTGNERAKN